MTWGVNGVTVRLGHHEALSGVSLDCPPGRVTAVVGGDGAGKSTLLRCLAGALPHESGEVRRPPAPAIGYLSAGSGTYPDLTVDENIEFAARAYGVAAAETASRRAELLGRTGLDRAHDRLAGHLSGGMRQKLGVIRAMLHRPDLLILDEPTTGVDPVSRADLWWLIAHAAAEGASVVMATAYLDEAERAAHILVLDRGHTLASGTVDEIIDAVPGSVVATSEPPPQDRAASSWRRGSRWHVWSSGPPVVTGGTPVRPDLHDAVIVAALNADRAA